MTHRIHIENVFDDNSPLIGKTAYYGVMTGGEVEIHSGRVIQAGNINVLLQGDNSLGICFRANWHSNPHISILEKALAGRLNIFGVSRKEVDSNVQAIRKKHQEHLDRQHREAEFSAQDEKLHLETSKAQAMVYLKKLESAIADGNTEIIDNFLAYGSGELGEDQV